MNKWMVRGLVFAAAMVVLRLFQGTLIDVWQMQAGLISIVLLILFIIGVVAWGLIDGREDARSQPDPDRRGDLAMIWLLAGLVAGLVSGAVTWLIAIFYKSVYAGGLVNELTTFAAFTALLVFLGGIGGVTLGRYLIDRKGAYAPREGQDDDRVDTDVFAAVRSDEAEEHGGAEAQEQRSSVATAEREEDEETTETIQRHESEERTEEVPTARDTERTEPTADRDEDQR